MVACLLFGFVTALELRAQSWGLPVSSYVMQMMPYCLALALLAGSADPPGCLPQLASLSSATDRLHEQ
jgi:ABC-type uncharacterized transport system permease subunit